MAISSEYRLAPAYLLRPAGVVVVVLAACWVVAVLLGAGDAVLMVLGLVTVAVLVGGTVAALRPPRLLRLGEEGYVAARLPGLGVREATWQSVENVSTVRLGVERAICLELTDGRRTVVPLALLGTRQGEVQAEVRRRLDHAHGYRRLAP